MSVSAELVNHYPWLPSLRIYYPNYESKNPIEFFKEVFDSHVNLPHDILKFFKFAFENREEYPDYETYKRDNFTIEFYLIIKILLYIINDKILANRIANLYSKVILNELENEGDANLYAIYTDMNLKIKYYEQPIIYRVNIVKDQRESLMTNFRLHFMDFLELSADLKDEYRKLINNSLLDGYVFIQQRSINRLIQEQVRKKLLVDNNEDVSSKESFKKELLKIDDISELYDQILAEWALKKESFEHSFEVSYKDGIDISTHFPPCIKEILTRAHESQNLGHTARLYLVFFLHALDYPVEKIVDIFSTVPDFDRSKTLYQVNFAKTKGYIPHKCSSLKSLNLCVAEKFKDEICIEGYFSKKLEEQKKISHPLSYVNISKYRASKEENNKKEDPEKN